MSNQGHNVHQAHLTNLIVLKQVIEKQWKYYEKEYF